MRWFKGFGEISVSDSSLNLHSALNKIGAQLTRSPWVKHLSNTDSRRPCRSSSPPVLLGQEQQNVTHNTLRLALSAVEGTSPPDVCTRHGLFEEGGLEKLLLWNKCIIGSRFQCLVKKKTNKNKQTALMSCLICSLPLWASVSSLEKQEFCGRLNTLHNRILASSRRQAGKVQLIPAPSSKCPYH